MHTLVILRHGESQWNRENRFTGWVDVPLSEKGEAEGTAAGKLMAAEGLDFDVAHTSVLKRAIKTLWLALEAMDRMWIPVVRDWRWNERMYGALQGLDKAETAARHGAEQVKLWRRSYSVRPPDLDRSSPMWPGRDPRYAALTEAQLPAAECLADTVARVLPCFRETIVPALAAGRRVLVVAHGNSLRALVKELEGISESDILELNIPTGIPRLYRLDRNLKVIEARYLGDPEAARRAAEAVAAQAARPRS